MFAPDFSHWEIADRKAFYAVRTLWPLWERENDASGSSASPGSPACSVGDLDNSPAAAWRGCRPRLPLPRGRGFSGACGTWRSGFPIQYRTFHYAIARADLLACARTTTLAVLRPDKLTCLAAYTPIIGIYLEMAGREAPGTEEDLLIFEHRQCCAKRVVNIPGHLDQAVHALLGIVQGQT